MSLVKTTYEFILSRERTIPTNFELINNYILNLQCSDLSNMEVYLHNNYDYAIKKFETCYFEL